MGGNGPDSALIERSRGRHRVQVRQQLQQRSEVRTSQSGISNSQVSVERSTINSTFAAGPQASQKSPPPRPKGSAETSTGSEAPSSLEEELLHGGDDPVSRVIIQKEQTFVSKHIQKPLGGGGGGAEHDDGNLTSELDKVQSSSAERRQKKKPVSAGSYQ
ncbi:hypothetical protein OJAV_G00177600 [Oryzias javanicus]|uniref:Uncharacterized protein n=1 Tax=Oryzias javanicus TaxID=123683 RepID=A0A3S2MLG9_ORYJA|nr:hypothetical protein OJAV_G00177600 [Oryzias javanicus]